MTNPILSIVIPVHNEEHNVEILHARIMKAVDTDKEIIFVDDGSTDDTLAAVKKVARADTQTRFLSLSKNFGHQAALKAGLDAAHGDCVVSMDGDLQHPPELIPELVSRWREGFAVVNTIREDQESLSRFKQVTSRNFYRLVNWLGGLNLEPGSADFRALDRQVLNALKSHPELGIFLRGLIPRLGFSQTSIRYQPEARQFGEPSYGLKQMARLALTGIVATSTRPLRFTTILAIVMGVISIGYSLYALFVYTLYDIAIPGWTSTVLAVTIIGSIQLLVLGIIGEYLAQTLNEVRRRPAYIVKETNMPDIEQD